MHLAEGKSEVCVGFLWVFIRPRLVEPHFDGIERRVFERVDVGGGGGGWGEEEDEEEEEGRDGHWEGVRRMLKARERRLGA